MERLLIGILFDALALGSYTYFMLKVGKAQQERDQRLAFQKNE